MTPQIVPQYTLQDLQKLRSLQRGEKIAEVKEEIRIIEKHFEQIRLVPLEVNLEVQTLAGLPNAIAPIFEKVKDAIIDGFLEALPQLSILRFFERELEKFHTFLKARALAEAKRLHPNELKNLGWEIGSTGDKLDYSQDLEHAQLQARLKAREDQLKRAHKVGKFVCEETGEEIHPIQVKTFATEYLRTYSLPKEKQ
jgi:RNA polymerase-binding transcription factor DksA